MAAEPKARVAKPIVVSSSSARNAPDAVRPTSIAPPSVTVTVTYNPGEMTLRVSNPLPAPGTEGPLTNAGTGYGLTGLRERAALADGTLTAAAADGRWTVLLRLPG